MSKTVKLYCVLQIFAGCGQPRLARKKREGEPEPEPEPEGASTYDFNTYKSRARPTTAAGTSLDRLVRDIKDKVKTAKDFWVQLPYTVCNDDEVAASPDSDDDCWNGQDRAR